MLCSVFLIENKLSNLVGNKYSLLFNFFFFGMANLFSGGTIFKFFFHSKKKKKVKLLFLQNSSSNNSRYNGNSDNQKRDFFHDTGMC